MNAINIQRMSRIELQGRLNWIQTDRTRIEQIISKEGEREREAARLGDGQTVFACRQAIQNRKNELERLVINEDATKARLDEYEKNRPDAEKLKAEIEYLHNETACRHVNEIIGAQNVIVQNLKEIEVINDRIGDLATEYLVLCGEAVYSPPIIIPVALREFLRMLTNPGSQDIVHGLEPLKPYFFRKEVE